MEKTLKRGQTITLLLHSYMGLEFYGAKSKYRLAVQQKSCRNSLITYEVKSERSKFKVLSSRSIIKLSWTFPN